MHMRAFVCTDEVSLVSQTWEGSQSSLAHVWPFFFLPSNLQKNLIRADK